MFVVASPRYFLVPFLIQVFSGSHFDACDVPQTFVDALALPNSCPVQFVRDVSSVIHFPNLRVPSFIGGVSEHGFSSQSSPVSWVNFVVW